MGSGSLRFVLEMRRLLLVTTVAFVTLVPAAVAAPVLPDLIADTSDGARLERSPDQLLLRFNGYVHNQGNGPLEVYGNAANVEQHIYEEGLASFMREPLPGASLSYEHADGHQHVHLQKIARYSLVDPTGTAPVAPAQKVGFCLLDSDSTRVDSANYRYGPNSCFPADHATNPDRPILPEDSVQMGVSAGWRDVYEAGLTNQWVVVSDVQPGNYLLRAEIDPDGLVHEAVEANPPADRPLTIPGHVAQPSTFDVPQRGPTAVPLGATAYTFSPDPLQNGSRVAPEPPGPRQFRIDVAPANGTVDARVGVWFSGDQVTYTPSATTTATQDTFVFSARDASSPFPQTPARAVTTLMLDKIGPPLAPSAAAETTPAPSTLGPPSPGPVGDQAAPALAVSGAPAKLVVGTAVQLSANAGGVAWSVDGVQGGSAGHGTVSDTGLLRAPAKVPSGGVVTVSARDGSRVAEVPVTIVAAPVVGHAPAANLSPKATRGLALAAVRTAGVVAATTRPGRAGTLRITMLAGERRLVTCTVKVRAGRTYACRAPQPRNRRQRVIVVATLRGINGRTVQRRVVAHAAPSGAPHSH